VVIFVSGVIVARDRAATESGFARDRAEHPLLHVARFV
jgi:hypothetical protein